MRAPLFGKCPITKASNTSHRAADHVGDDTVAPPTSVLTPTLVSGPIRPPSPSPPEQGQGSPILVGGDVSIFSQDSLSRVDVPALPPSEPVVVSCSDGSRRVGVSKPAIGHSGPVAQVSSFSSSRKMSRGSSPYLPKGTTEMVKVLFLLFSCLLSFF